MDKKTIPHVVYILTKLELGGAQKVCLTLFEALKKTTNGASLISGIEGILTNKVHNDQNVFLLPSFKREVGLFSLINEIKTLISLTLHIKKLRKKHPTLIVHTHSTKAGIIGRWAAWLAGVKIIIHTVHGFGFHTYQNKIIWWLIFLTEYFTQIITSHFIFVSSSDVAIGKKFFTRTKKNSSIIRAAVDWNKFYQPAKIINITQKPFIIGSVACFKPQKNCLDLLRALNFIISNKILNQPVLLEIIGDGVGRLELESFIAEHKLEQYVRLVGWQHNVETWMNRWQLFALSSLWEGLPCSIVEARLNKLPVIAYNVGGISDIIINGKNGYLIPPKNWELLALKIASLINNPIEYKKIAMNNDYLNNYKNTTMISEHIVLYKKLNSKQKP